MIDFEATMQPLIEQAALRTAREFYGYTTVEDLQQELWLFALESRDKMTEYLREGEVGTLLVCKALSRAALKAAKAEKTQVVGVTEDEGHYSVTALRTLLPDVFDYRNWQSFGLHGDGQPQAKRIEATSDRLTMLVDVKNAVDKLDPRNYSIITAKWKYSYNDTQLKEMLEVGSEGAARAATTRAVRALQKVLLGEESKAKENGPQGAVSGRRRVMSNSAWRANTASNWED